MTAAAEELRRGPMLVGMGMTMSLVTLAWLPVAPLLSVEPLRQVAVGQLVVSGLGVVLLARAGALRAASWLLLAAVWLTITVSVSIAGASSAPAAAGFLILVFAAGLLLGTRAAIGVAAIGAATGTGITLAVASGALNGDPPTASQLVAWLILLVSAACVASVSTHQIEAALDASRRHREELEESNQLLEESREQYRRLIESASDLVTEIDLTGNFVYASPSFLEGLGWRSDELVGHPPSEFTHPDDRAIVGGALGTLFESGGSVTIISRFRHSDGRWIWFESTGNSIELQNGERRLAIISRDVMERRRLEEELRQSQRFESLGMLAGGIAHDFNNLLVGIQGNAELLRAELAESSQGHAMLLDIERSSLIASGLTDQLLTYAGKRSTEERALDLTELVVEMAHLIDVQRPGPSNLTIEVATREGWVEADASQLRQVVMNLVINAIESIAVSGGRVLVKIGRLAIDPSDLPKYRLSEGLSPGDYVFVEVRDEGCGMTDETIERIFDPFFTTKFQGRGLGLAAVLGIVGNHKGMLAVESALGEGTTIRVLLPSSPAPESSIAVVPESVTRCSHGSVLVIDDDALVRRTMGRALEGLGFDVLLTASGSEGIEAVTKQPGGFVCVLLDLTMPLMSGTETFEKLRVVAPELPVIFMSGHSEEVLLGTLSDHSLARTLKKPFTRKALGATLGDLLPVRGSG